MEANSTLKAMSAAMQGMNAQAYRLQIVSENLSNADTHGYKRKIATFENTFNQTNGIMELRIGSVSLDQTPGELMYEPGHSLADANGYVAMSNVDMMIELADAREAGRSYEANLSTFKQATQMYTSLISLLRR